MYVCYFLYRNRWKNLYTVYQDVTIILILSWKIHSLQGKSLTKLFTSQAGYCIASLLKEKETLILSNYNMTENYW